MRAALTSPGPTKKRKGTAKKRRAPPPPKKKKAAPAAATAAAGGKKTSTFRGVSFHSRSGRFESHCWHRSYGRQRFLVRFEFFFKFWRGRKSDKRKNSLIFSSPSRNSDCQRAWAAELAAAEAFDLAQLCFLGEAGERRLNFAAARYPRELRERLAALSADDLTESLRAQASASKEENGIDLLGIPGLVRKLGKPPEAAEKVEGAEGEGGRVGAAPSAPSVSSSGDDNDNDNAPAAAKAAAKEPREKEGKAPAAAAA